MCVKSRSETTLKTCVAACQTNRRMGRDRQTNRATEITYKHSKFIRDKVPVAGMKGCSTRQTNRLTTGRIRNAICSLCERQMQIVAWQKFAAATNLTFAPAPTLTNLCRSQPLIRVTKICLPTKTTRAAVV